MIRPERDRISGIVEVDETYVAGVEEQRRGARQRDSNKSIVIAAIEVRGRGSGRIRLAVVEDLSAASLAMYETRTFDPNAGDRRSLVTRFNARRGWGRRARAPLAT